MRNLEFTTGISTTCDSCGRPTSAGFHHLHMGTPVLFDCVACVGRATTQEAIREAIEAHKVTAHLRMEHSQGEDAA
jgi:bacterioferritin-associated ferredoxin